MSFAVATSTEETPALSTHLDRFHVDFNAMRYCIKTENQYYVKERARKVATADPLLIAPWTRSLADVAYCLPYCCALVTWIVAACGVNDLNRNRLCCRASTIDYHLCCACIIDCGFGSCSLVRHSREGGWWSLGAESCLHSGTCELDYFLYPVICGRRDLWGDGGAAVGRGSSSVCGTYLIGFNSDASPGPRTVKNSSAGVRHVFRIGLRIDIPVRGIGTDFVTRHFVAGRSNFARSLSRLFPQVWHCDWHTSMQQFEVTQSEEEGKEKENRPDLLEVSSVRVSASIFATSRWRGNRAAPPALGDGPHGPRLQALRVSACGRPS